MVDGRRKHHFVKSPHFSENHQIVQNLHNSLGLKRAVRFKKPMPVLSKTKQLLPFRRRLVFCNQIAITHPFETDDLLTDFANFIIASRTAGLAPFLRVEVSCYGRHSRRGRSINSPLSNELHVPALLYQRHLNFAVRCCTRLARYNFKFSESSRTAGP